MRLVLLGLLCAIPALWYVSSLLARSGKRRRAWRAYTQVRGLELERDHPGRTPRFRSCWRGVEVLVEIALIPGHDKCRPWTRVTALFDPPLPAPFHVTRRSVPLHHSGGVAGVSEIFLRAMDERGVRRLLFLGPDGAVVEEFLRREGDEITEQGASCQVEGQLAWSRLEAVFDRAVEVVKAIEPGRKRMGPPVGFLGARPWR